MAAQAQVLHTGFAGASLVLGGVTRAGDVSPTSIERNPPLWSPSTLNIPNSSQVPLLLLLLFLYHPPPPPFYSFYLNSGRSKLTHPAKIFIPLDGKDVRNPRDWCLQQHVPNPPLLGRAPAAEELGKGQHSRQTAASKGLL